MPTRELVERLLTVRPDFTYQEMGEIVGCSRQRVYQVAREAGLTKKSRLNREDITAERVLQLYYHSELLIKDIARIFGCRPLTIARRLRAVGISQSEAHSRKEKLYWRRVREATKVVAK